MGISLSRFSFTTTMRVIDWIHHHPAYIRTPAKPANPSRLPHVNILMIRIANLSDSGHAGRKDSTHFTGPEPHLHIVAITSHHLSRTTRTPNQLSTFAGPQLHIMNSRSQR